MSTISLPTLTTAPVVTDFLEAVDSEVYVSKAHALLKQADEAIYDYGTLPDVTHSSYRDLIYSSVDVLSQFTGSIEEMEDALEDLIEDLYCPEIVAVAVGQL